MSNIINTLGMAIIAGKYTLILLIASLTFVTGASAGDLALIAGLESGD
ncbi:hypothetical protein [Photobacterium alginatilyticum]|nr:hypothetical protein [Photobacterium alginatilyticum]